ncbi:hypothetical protein [Anaerophilus nitritogenes]|uniref:hypothetical protein n=1 Tax=Anaerophilus nitritogenes TaxID=2498136 RepID=UPI0013EA3675|nr:hypothetical protein [Anaerophilus nitritogenes]
MEYIRNILNVGVVVFIFILGVKIYMKIASYIGERLGLGKFFINLCKKIRKKYNGI